MDIASKVLSKFTSDLRFEDLSPEVIRYTKHLTLDTLGVALGAYLSEPSFITRSVVRELGGRPEATIFGSGEKTSSSLAALANGVMVRYLDFMDIYANVDTIHPSENIPTALAVGERQHSSGKDVLLGIFLGFELQGRMADTFPTAKSGFHHVTTGGFVTPFIAGKLLGLSEDQMANAMGIASCTNLTASYVGGQISMIKALGYPFAAQRGIEAALMAQKGMTGKVDMIEYFNQLKFNTDLTPLLKGGDKPRILGTGIKYFAADFLAQSPLDALFAIIKEHPVKPEEVESMTLTTYDFALRVLANKESYKPETKEKADHSMAYCLAMALIEGALGPEQYAREQWKDPKVIDLMSKIKVLPDAELSKLYPKAQPADLEIRTTGGQIYRKRIDYPKGHPKNPMSDEEVQAKFRKLARLLMRERKIVTIIETVNSLEKVKDISELMQLLAV